MGLATTSRLPLSEDRTVVGDGATSETEAADGSMFRALFGKPGKIPTAVNRWDVAETRREE